MSSDPDPNATISGALRDMATVQTQAEKQRAYKDAANAIRGLDEQIASLRQPDGTLPRIARIGPSSARVIMEVLETGTSATVERAIGDSGKRDEVEKRRGWRRGFMSHAAARAVVAATPQARRCTYQGDLQMHSTWSDGSQTLADIVDACLARGYTYSAVTDHSGGLAVANGLSPERLRRQAGDLAALNARYEGRFRLLRGVEANIGADGEVDVPLEDRRDLDLVLAAPHSGLRSAAPQTERLLAAVRAPHVHILAHPRGRKYDARAGIAADWDRVFEAAARAGVAIEIDGDPSRQDLDFAMARRAADAGCLIALDSDAHAVGELSYVTFALAHAYLAGIAADRIVNAWPLERLLEWAQSRSG